MFLQFYNLFTAMQAAQKIFQREPSQILPFTAMQAAQKYPVLCNYRHLEFTAMQAAQKINRF